MKGAGGRIFTASVNQVVMKEDDGRVRTRAVVHDLTSEREMHKALKASEDRFQRFFEEAPLGIVQVGPESAASVPGPACYGLGGKRPAVTDADLVLGYLDYPSKRAGFGPVFTPTGDYEADMRTILAFYADKRGRHPERMSVIKTD